MTYTHEPHNEHTRGAIRRDNSPYCFIRNRPYVRSMSEARMSQFLKPRKR
jgi:hypothetical protein